MDRQFLAVLNTAVLMDSSSHLSLCSQNNNLTSMVCRCGDLFS
jgi:hypothetical protein